MFKSLLSITRSPSRSCHPLRKWTLTVIAHLMWNWDWNFFRFPDYSCPQKAAISRVEGLICGSYSITKSHLVWHSCAAHGKHSDCERCNHLCKVGLRHRNMRWRFDVLFSWTSRLDCVWMVSQSRPSIKWLGNFHSELRPFLSRSTASVDLLNYSFHQAELFEWLLSHHPKLPNQTKHSRIERDHTRTIIFWKQFHKNDHLLKKTTVNVWM
jgi:hypothetical protein